MIHVTKSFLPDMEEYVKYLQGIWERGHINNRGPLVQELEERIREFLGVNYFFLVTNGTVALQLAIKATELKGQVITTPFSFIATTSSLAWEGCQPVFADIDPSSLTITPESIEAVLTPKCTGILATHVYGNPCNVESIASLAERKGLRVIYDAAHAFGVEYKGRSILSHGDVSIVSFHATKLFHTIEGGGIITNDKDIAQRIESMRNFGYDRDNEISEIGINGKTSEFHAAMGLCILPKVNEIIARRKEIAELYDKLLPHDSIQFLELNPNTTRYNYAYYPIIFQSEERLLAVMSLLRKEDIHPRRYFYPSLNTLNYVTNNLTKDYSTSLSKRVLCLPLYPELLNEDVIRIAKLIQSALC